MPIRKLVQLVQSQGLPDAALECVSRPIRIATRGKVDLRRFYIFTQPLDVPASKRGASLSVRRVEPADELLSQFPRPASELAERFAAGCWCFAAVIAGRLAGFMWVQRGLYEEPDAKITFVGDGRMLTWDFDVYIAPEHRCSFVFHRLWAEVAAYLKERGSRFSASLIWSRNDASIRAQRRLGASVIGSGYQLKIGSWVLTGQSTFVVSTEVRQRYIRFI